MPQQVQGEFQALEILKKKEFVILNLGIFYLGERDS